MKKLFVFIAIVSLQIGNAQTFLNGSFEVTTATMVCHYNLANPTFNSYFAETVAFGAANEMEIYLTKIIQIQRIPYQQDGTMLMYLMVLIVMELIQFS